MRINIPNNGKPSGRKFKYVLWASRADGTGASILEMGNDKEALEKTADRRTNVRTKFWVEEAPKPNSQSA